MWFACGHSSLASRGTGHHPEIRDWSDGGLWLGGVSTDKFFWYCLIIFLTLNLMVFYGVMAVYITADLVFGSVLSGFFYGFWCGPDNVFVSCLFCACNSLPIFCMRSSTTCLLDVCSCEAWEPLLRTC